MMNFATSKEGDIFTMEGYFVKVPWRKRLVMFFTGERYVPKLKEFRVLKVGASLIEYEEVKP